MNSTHKPWIDVQEFQTKILKLEPPTHVGPVCFSRMRHNIGCLQEEIQEFQDAVDNEDMVGMADALVDLIYFAYGFGYQMGFPMDDIWDVVHAANMTKVRGLTKRGVEGDAAKPEGWRDPKEIIKELLA